MCLGTTTRKHSGDPLAQLVEHNTFNVGVLGSSPKRITKKRGFPMASLFCFPACVSHPRVLAPLHYASVSSRAEREPQADHKKERLSDGLSFLFPRLRLSPKGSCSASLRKRLFQSRARAPSGSQKEAFRWPLFFCFPACVSHPRVLAPLLYASVSFLLFYFFPFHYGQYQL